MDVVDGKIVSAVENKRGSCWSSAKRSSEEGSVLVAGDLDLGLGLESRHLKTAAAVACPAQLGKNSSPLLVLSDDFLVDMQQWLAAQMMNNCCSSRSSNESSSTGIAHTRELDGYDDSNAPPPSSPPELKRQKSCSRSSICRDGWIPPAAGADHHPISPPPPHKAAAAATDCETALALVRRSREQQQQQQQQRWENFTQQMNHGLYVVDPPFSSPLRKKIGGGCPLQSFSQYCPEQQQLLASCKKSAFSYPPVSSASSLPLLVEAKTTSGGVPAAAVAASYNGTMRLQTTASAQSILPGPHTIQSSLSSSSSSIVFDTQCSSSVIGSSQCCSSSVAGSCSSCVPDIIPRAVINYGSAAAARRSNASCAMMSSGFGSDAVSLTMKSWMSQERNVRETSSSVCSTRADPMHTDEDSVRRHMHQLLSRHMHSAGPPPSPLSCSRVVGEKGSLLPPTDSGPDNTPAHMSWASYSQTANSVFSTKPSQVRGKSRSWTEPLRFLLRKELTITDVGELGRIILPKKDAESKLPQLDAKEGQFLQMEDYNSNRHWNLRFKWWPNNKSRMYVLESTGEFIKFYELKEKDVLTLYKDAEEKLVIRGQKSTPSFLRNDSMNDPATMPSYSSKYTGRRSIKGVCSRAAATTSTPTIPTPSSSALIQPPRHCGRRASNLTGPVASLVSEVKKEDTLEVKLENKGSSSSSGEGSIINDATGSPPKSGYGSSSGGKDKFLPLPTSIKPTNPTHLDTKPLNYDLMLVPGVQVGQAAFAEVGNDLVEVVDIDNPSLGYLLQQENTGFDWGKLPDPPALELPGFKIEESWGDSMQILRCLNISSSGAFVQN